MPVTIKPTCSHIFHIFHRCICWMYMHICVIFWVTSINHMRMRTVHILHKLHFCYLHIPPNEYGCHTKNIGHTILILSWHINMKLVHTWQKKASYMQYQLHIFLPYMCQKQICLLNSTYMPYFDGQISGIYIPIYATHEITGINYLTRSSVHI